MTTNMPESGQASHPPIQDGCPDTALSMLGGSADASTDSLRSVAETLSHELRTPLTTIYSGSKLLSRHGPRLSEAMVREVSSAMAADAERLLRVVEDLVVAAALPDEPAIRGEPLLLQRALSAAAHAAEARWVGWTVAVSMPVGMPPVAADQVHVEQVLRNLLDNAAQYGPPHGTIVMQAALTEDRVEIHVLDRGPGVDPDQTELVFQLFARPGTASHQGGLGLGLFVSRRLVERMGGRMWVAPRAGGGSDFGFDLPLYPVD
jgi:two-component system sensor histidine kinase KdpD